MQQDKFKEIMTMLGEAYNKQITPLMAKMYWQALKGHSDLDVEQAVIKYISSPEHCQFFPQAGSLIAFISGTEKQKQVATDDAALNAWELIIKQVRSKGAYGSLELDDKLALKAVQSIGGWIELCHTQESKMEWRRKEFISAYHTFTGSQDLPQSLAGIGQKNSEEIEARNQLNNIMEKAQDGLSTQASDRIESR